MRILQERSADGPDALDDPRDPALILCARAQFRVSVAKLNQLPPAEGLEVAIAGRSNAGKSSALNALARRRKLAFASKMPGRTQLINYFDLDERSALVDLPGYGYAAAPKTLRSQWQALAGGYLAQRQNLAGLLLLMDIRHPLAPLDCQLLDWFAPRRLPVHVLLTKADKLTRNAQHAALSATQAMLARRPPSASVQLFSAHAETGIAAAARQVASWLRPDLFPNAAALKNKRPPVKGE